ncbi:hypothetical protein H257_17500, partial [Aphanomyces astaci]
MVQDIAVDATVDEGPWEEIEEVVKLLPVVGRSQEPVATAGLRRSARQQAAMDGQQRASRLAYKGDEMGIRYRK